MSCSPARNAFRSHACAARIGFEHSQAAISPVPTEASLINGTPSPRSTSRSCTPGSVENAGTAKSGSGRYELWQPPVVYLPGTITQGPACLSASCSPAVPLTAKSLMRTLGPKSSPQARNLYETIDRFQHREELQLRLQAVPLESLT